MKSGIYCIENLVNGKRYIGQTKNLTKRKSKHFNQLRKNEHNNVILQNSFNKYGEERFVFNILIYCESPEMEKYEQFFVDFFYPNIFNIRKMCVTSSLGIEYTEERKLKLSERFSGKGNPMYGKIGELNPMYGKKHSDEVKRKISENRKGKASGENNPMFGKATFGMLGKKHSDETKKIISDAKKEYWRKRREE